MPDERRMSDTQVLEALNAMRGELGEHVRTNTAQHERLFDRLEEQGREMTRVATMAEFETTACAEERADIRRIIVGNGEPGHAERLRNVERAIESGSKMIRWAMIGVAGVLGSLLWQVIVWAIEKGATQ